MFSLAYLSAELRRRSGRTLLTALGLAVGVGLVVTVSALSRGIDEAQQQVLEPLTGVGTDLSVTRPIDVGGGGFENLSEAERQQLQEENGGARLRIDQLGDPGEKFSTDTFAGGAQLSLDSDQVAAIRGLDGVASAVGGLTLNAVHIEGTVPDISQFQQPGQGTPPGPGGGGGDFRQNIDVDSRSVSGVDVVHSGIGALTADQIVKGRFLEEGAAREAVLNESYAGRNDLGVGDKVALGGKSFTFVGIAKTPLGGQASDVYVKLGQLQELSGRTGRVNTVYVRADSADDVESVATAIEGTVEGASVTTAADLAERVSGSIVDAKSLSDRLGRALAIVALLAAFLIASLLTLASVTRRIRELGTLKAIGWTQWRVVRQVTGESLVQGLLGGALGIALGLLGVLAVDALAPELKATVADAAQAAAGPGGFGFRGGGPFGQGDVITSGSEEIPLNASVSVALLAGAVGLALLGGLIAGAVGGLRAARLRPADALRHLD
jgi:ABC-type antimicrobial peptide transport system permease subunit